MNVSEVLETEILRHCLLPIEGQASTVMASFQPKQLEIIRHGLSELLLAEAKSGQVPVITQELTIQGPRNFKSILYRGRSGSKIVAFTFSDAVTETMFQILGLAIALFTTGLSLANMPQLGGILKTLWGKLVVLKPPSDSDAIDVLEALVRVRARHIVSNIELYPMMQEIQIEARLSTESAKVAFTKLRSKRIIEVVTWGDQEEDVANLGNRWKVIL
jgi:hypothetical protein